MCLLAPQRSVRPSECSCTRQTRRPSTQDRWSPCKFLKPAAKNGHPTSHNRRHHDHILPRPTTRGFRCPGLGALAPASDTTGDLRCLLNRSSFDVRANEQELESALFRAYTVSCRVVSRHSMCALQPGNKATCCNSRSLLTHSNEQTKCNEFLDMWNDIRINTHSFHRYQYSGSFGGSGGFACKE